MKAVTADARRYMWCRSRALWIMGTSTRAFLEDAHGAQQADQGALLRFVSRMIGEGCVVALNVAVNQGRPIPDPAMRCSWALDQLQGHELWQACWELIRGIEEIPAEEIVERCEKLVTAVSAVVGEMPNPIAPEGHYPAIALARDWIGVMALVGEEPPMPSDWTLPT
jgi:hypothetical protein